MRRLSRFLLLYLPSLLCCAAAVYSIAVSNRALKLLSAPTPPSVTPLPAPPSPAPTPTPTPSSILTREINARLNSGLDQPKIDYDDPLLRRRIIVLASGVNNRMSYEVISKLLYMGMNDDARPITLYIVTYGGWYEDAFAVLDAMRLIKAPVNVWAVGN